MLVDENGADVPVEQALLLFVSLLARSGRTGSVVVPITITSRVDELLEGTGLTVTRTQASLAELTRSAAEKGVVFGGAVGGGYVFPEFLPAYDAITSLCKLLELLAGVDEPISALVADLPRPTLLHRQIACPWGKKGLVMRLLNERFQGREVDLLDGIKVYEERGWAQVLPDPDEPLIHLYAEGETADDSEALELDIQTIVEAIMEGDAAPARTLEKA